MRRVLDALYRASGGLAAVFMVAIGVIVLLQVGANIIDAAVGWVTGTAIGLVIPSYAEFAGFFLAAASFLALAYTLRHGAHIRVSLVVQHFGPRLRSGTELWCAAVGAAMAGYFAWYAVELVVESYHYDDLSTGLIAVPLWIPQAAVALGLIVLTIALVDAFVSILLGRPPAEIGAPTDSHADR